jgi:hypothetical protein
MQNALIQRERIIIDTDCRPIASHVDCACMTGEAWPQAKSTDPPDHGFPSPEDGWPACVKTAFSNSTLEALQSSRGEFARLRARKTTYEMEIHRVDASLTSH